MEESISLLDLIKQSFELKEVDIRAYSPLTLAYIGDCVYDLVIRTVVVERGNEPANKLHKKTVAYVKAQTQASMIEALLPYLTEEEEAVYKRGRNAKSYTSAKYESIVDYLKAKGFEKEPFSLKEWQIVQEARIMELIKTGLKELSMTL